VRTGRAGRQGAQVFMLVGVQFQGAGESIGDGRAGVGLLAALEPGVVVDTHPGERGDFLPAQPGGTAHARPLDEAHVSRGDLGAPRVQETPQFRTAAVVAPLTCHGTSVPRPRRARLG
jgi:hypothetical protein